VIILDTNVVSEPTRPASSKAVRQWVIGQQQDQLFTTSITQAEMLLGVDLLPDGLRRGVLAEQVYRIFTENFAGRVLPFDSAAAREFPLIVMLRRKRGKPIMEADALIAAIARSRGASLATRNIKDFDGCGIDVVNPWTAGVK
jgi:predicted nucleic acid-binding protein